MAYNHYYEALLNDEGRGQIGYFARVINTSTQAIVPIYSDINGTPISVVSGVSNAAKTDTSGNLSLFVDPGTYHLDIYAPDQVTFLKRIQSIPMNSSKGDKGDQGDQGEPGPAFATFSTLAAFKAAPITNATQVLKVSGIAPGTFLWTLGNYTGQADDLNIIKADSTALSAGAWVRQGAEGITFQALGGGAIVRDTRQKAREIVSVTDFGAKGGSGDDRDAFNRAILSVFSDAGGVAAGGEVIVPFLAGGYNLGSQFNIYQGVHLRVLGRGQIINKGFDGLMCEVSNGGAVSGGDWRGNGRTGYAFQFPTGQGKQRLTGVKADTGWVDEVVFQYLTGGSQSLIDGCSLLLYSMVTGQQLLAASIRGRRLPKTRITFLGAPTGISFIRSTTQATVATISIFPKAPFRLCCGAIRLRLLTPPSQAPTRTAIVKVGASSAPGPLTPSAQTST